MYDVNKIEARCKELSAARASCWCRTGNFLASKSSLLIFIKKYVIIYIQDKRKDKNL